jgi:hypothetical protein
MRLLDHAWALRRFMIDAFAESYLSLGDIACLIRNLCWLWIAALKIGRRGSNGAWQQLCQHKERTPRPRIAIPNSSK